MPRNHMAEDGNSEGAPDPLATFNEYRSLLFSIAYRMLGTVADAEDMLQVAAISRADVAEFLVSEIQQNAHIHEIVGITARK
jgi:Sigma-70 region 2